MFSRCSGKRAKLEAKEMQCLQYPNSKVKYRSHKQNSSKSKFPRDDDLCLPLFIKKKACNGIITEYVICSLVQRTTALNTVITPVSPMPMQSALPKGSSNESLHAQGQFMPCIRIYLRNLTPCSWEKAGLFLPNSLRALLPEFTQAP